jgi:DNA-binding XRE family transcriptional regulator
MKETRSILKILKINCIEEYKASLLFNNGESRWVDFYRLLHEKLRLTAGKVGYQLLADASLFSAMRVMGTTIGWEEVGLESGDEHGKQTFYPFELDPWVLYENSEPDETRAPLIGMMIRAARQEAGLTQAALARRSGTTKSCISRLENQQADVGLATLRRIVEEGLGKKLQVGIQ